MNSALLQQKIYSGYAKAALRVGPIYTQYRPVTAMNPLATARATFNASFNAEDMKYGRPNKYGKPTWFGLFDGTLTQVGDYLVGPSGTFFIAAQQLTLPILVVECNRVASFYRQQQQTGVGALPYGGTTLANETLLAAGWPCSILQGAKGEKSAVNLPGDIRNPWFSVLVPAMAGVVLRTTDLIMDDLSRRYEISSAELTDLGWRCTVAQVQT